MPSKMDHQAYMAFVSKLTDLVSEYTAEDLYSFLASARRGFPCVVPVVEACIKMLNSTAATSSSDASAQLGQNQDRPGISCQNQWSKSRPRLSDLLLSRTLFSTNKDLIRFATRVLPDMPDRRYDKMSRTEIVRRICDYLDELNSRKRHRLEAAMRKAIDIISAEEERQVDSFFSQWERIIKGIDL